MKKPNLPSKGQIEKELLKRRLESSLLDFTVWKFKNLKKTDFHLNWHHEVIAHELEKVYLGETQFLLVTIPPRYTKTEIAVKSFMEWSFAKNPQSKFLHLSYSDDLALDNSSEVKDTLMTDEYREIWPIEFKADSKSKKKWYTAINGNKAGGVYATSTGGQITGFGAGGVGPQFEGAIIIDDPLKPEDARSETVRGNINERFNNTIKSRMNNPSKTPIIVIMQRLHEDDMAGFLLNEGSEFKFKHLNLPAINEDGPSEYDPRQIGEALWPEKHSIKQLEMMQEKSRDTYAGQYQQRPAPKEGKIIKEAWVKTYRPSQLPPGGNDSLSVDATFKDGKKSDFVVIQAWRQYQADFYLMGQVRRRMGFTETIVWIANMAKQYPEVFEILIEDKANGSAIIDVLKRRFPGVIPINPKESKEARLQAVAPAWEAGNVFVPEAAPWTDDFRSELLFFPNAKHDDQVDAMTQYINKKRLDSNYSLEAILTL